MGNGLGADEAAFHVAVDFSRCLGSRGAVRDRPGACLLRTRGEERDEPEHLMGGTDDPVEARFSETEFLEKGLAFIPVGQHGEF